MVKKIGLLAVVALSLAVLPAFADGIGSDTVTVSGTYGAGTAMTPFSAPGDSFTLSFVVPSSILLAAPGATMTSSPITVTLNSQPVVGGLSNTGATSLSETFDVTSQLGLVDIQSLPTNPADLSGLEWSIEGFGLGTVSGQDFNLIPGTYLINDPNSGNTDSAFISFDSRGIETDGNISGTVTVTSGSTSVPEPPAGILLLGGLVGLALLAGKRRGLLSPA